MGSETQAMQSDHSVGGRWTSARDAARAVQKPGGGVPAYMRWVNRPAGRFVAVASYAFGLSPTAVTLLSLFLSVGGMAVLVALAPDWWVGVLAALLFAAAFAFDSADGQLARISGSAGPAGEWLDHVVDSVRTPAVHLVVAFATWQQQGSPTVLVVAALAMSVTLSGQFMSQMLAEQLLRRGGAARRRGAAAQSWVLLPTDPGVWAWSFVLWGSPPVFAWAYCGLAALNVLHTGASMARRYRDLRDRAV